MRQTLFLFCLLIFLYPLRLSTVPQHFNSYAFLNRRLRQPLRIVRGIDQIRKLLVVPLIEIYKQTGKIKILVDRDGTTDKNCIPLMLALKKMGVIFGMATGGNIEDVVRELGTLGPFNRVYANNAEFWYDVDGNGQYHLVRGDPNAGLEINRVVEKGIEALKAKFKGSVREISLRRGGGATVWYDRGRNDISQVSLYVEELKKWIEDKSDYKVFSSPTAAMISRATKGNAADDMQPHIAIGDGWQENWGVDTDMAKPGAKIIGLNVGPAEGIPGHIYTIEGIKNAAATKLFLDILLEEITKIRPQ